jgi:hypothetical protein
MELCKVVCLEKDKKQMKHESLGGIIIVLVDTPVYGIYCSDMVRAR